MVQSPMRAMREKVEQAAVEIVGGRWTGAQACRDATAANGLPDGYQRAVRKKVQELRPLAVDVMSSTYLVISPAAGYHWVLSWYP